MSKIEKLTVEAGTIGFSKLSIWESIKIWFKEGTWIRNTVDVWTEKDEITAEDLDSKKIHIFEPIRPYSKTEAKKLDVIIEHETQKGENALFIEDLLTAINLIRPNTVDVNGDMNQFYNHKYYKFKKVQF